jgi:hypothetical protein
MREKRSAVSCLAAIFALVLSLGNSALAAEAPDALRKKLSEYAGAERGRLAPIEDEALARAFSGYSFYVLRFRRYPVALAPPAPLKSNNLFVVKPERAVEYVPDAEGLKRFFAAALAPVKTDAAARDAARAWLKLAQEFHQDGFFEFSIPEDSLRVRAAGSGGREASGKAVVNPQGGNAGEIGVSLAFDSAGGLTSVSESASLNQGIRPICQATKLLDPDPIVRGMAEQSLLVMGRTAKEYLDEQRAKAGPELRAAIDEIWRRIVAEGR